jgi:hypothetical protein
MLGRRHARVLLAVIGLLGCNRVSGCRERPLAELLQAKGTVTRDVRGRENQWLPAEVGASFSWGDGLRTATASSAQLRVGTSGRVMVESDTIIRLLARPGSSDQAPVGFAVAEGSATIESVADALTIQTRGGTALLKPGTRVELRPAAQGESYRVMMGGATFTQEDGQTKNVEAGHSVSIGIGLAVFDAEPGGAAAQPSAVAAAPTSPAVADASVGPAATAASDAGSTPAEPAALSDDSADKARNARSSAEQVPDGPADLIVPVGETFNVYDPHPPTLIGFSFGSRCESGADVVVDKAASLRGEEHVSAAVAAGAHTYTVRCLQPRDGKPEKTLLRGSFRVLRSDGSRPLPKSAPRDAIDLDGHKYRLMYQGLRPAIVTTWLSPPQASEYVLTIQSSNGRTKNFRSAAPSYVIESDGLGDGKHVLFMTANDTAKTRSKPTTVEIAFDNAAPTASIEAPPPAGYPAEEPVEIRGIALEGSKVSIAGEAVDLDRERRFTHTITPPAGSQAVAIRIQHSAHGVRYYLRRVLSARR